MKKVIPIILVLIFVLTGIAAADAPFEITISLSGADSTYTTSVIVNSGNQISIKLGETDVTLTVQEKQDGALNFQLEPGLDHLDEKYGLTTLSYFLQPSEEPISFTEPGKTAPVLTLSWKELSLDPLYEEVIAKVAAVLRREGETEDNFSYLYSMMAGREEANDLGFYVEDLDLNGTPELLFGINEPMMNRTGFYDLYTIKDGELISVFSGGERSRYYLTENGPILHEGSNSAFNSFTSLSSYKDGKLQLLQSFIYDARTNEEHPWFFSTSSEYEVTPDAAPIEESDVLYNIALYPEKLVTLEPFF